MMSRWAEGWRASAGELTFDAICTASRNTAAFGVNQSRSLKYAGSFAQLYSSARLVEHALLERFRLCRVDLNITAASAQRL